LKKLAQSLLIPDYSIIDLFSFWKKLRSIVHDKNIQIIIITVPKHGISLIAIFAKFFYKHKVNIILDYRDSWNTQPIFCQTSFFGNIISRYFEKLVLNNIDYFTFVSPIVPKLIKTELGIDLSNRSLLIYNGFDSSLGIRYRESNIIMGDKLKLMYIGSANDRLKSYRNVSFLFEYTIHNPNVYIDFYGELELTNHNLQQYPNISFKGSVPTNKLKEISADYNWCIVLHTDKNSSREVIPGKFYDCINLKLPVLCLADQNSEVSQMVSRYNIGIVCNPSIKDILDNQHKLFDNDLLNLLNTNLTNDSLQLFERDNQLLKFLDIIKAI